MDHPVFINNQHIKTEAEMQRDLNKAAKLFQRYAEEKILFIYASDKNSPMEAYETFFGSENFMHLCGYKIRKEVSGYKAARDFYKTCLYGVPEEFKSNRLFYNFTNSRKETSAKIDALLNLLDYRHVKLYKIGPKEQQPSAMNLRSVLEQTGN